MAMGIGVVARSLYGVELLSVLTAGFDGVECDRGAVVAEMRLLRVGGVEAMVLSGEGRLCPEDDGLVVLCLWCRLSMMGLLLMVLMVLARYFCFIFLIFYILLYLNQHVFLRIFNYIFRPSLL